MNTARPTHPRPRIAVSSCLLGAPFRHDGGHSRDRFLADRLSRHVDWVSICPEMELGLGAPRAALHLRTDGALVTGDGTADHTAAMLLLADDRVPGLDEIDGYVFKSRSPSCGLFRLPRYAAERQGERNGGQPVDRDGRGLFAALILDALPDLPAEEEGRLNDPMLREHFVERVFAVARLRELFAGDWGPGDLVVFHRRHKMQLLAHAPSAYRETGRIVARAGTTSPAELEAEYRQAFTAALAARVSRGRHANVLQHGMGFVSDRLDPARRNNILTAIETYRRGQAPLSIPVTLLRHHAEGEDLPYLSEQTYLDPFPADLALRHHL